MSILRYIRLGWTEIGKTLAAFITDTIEGAKVCAECSEMTGYYNGYRDGQVDVLRKMAAEAERDAAKFPDDPGEFDLKSVCQRCWMVHPERACDQ